MFDKSIDVGRNVRLIELIKCEILTRVSSLFKTLSFGNKEEVRPTATETLAEIIINSHLLSKRLGIGYHSIERELHDKIKLKILEGSEMEDSYNDLSELMKHPDARSQKRSENGWA